MKKFGTKNAYKSIMGMMATPSPMAVKKPPAIKRGRRQPKMSIRQQLKVT